MTVPILSGVGVVLDESAPVFIFNSTKKMEATAEHRVWKRAVKECIQRDLRNIRGINNGRL